MAKNQQEPFIKYLYHMVLKHCQFFNTGFGDFFFLLFFFVCLFPNYVLFS